MKNIFLRLAAAASLALAFACGGESDPPVFYNVPVVGVAIDGKAPRMMVGEKLSLAAQIMPVRATNSKVTWTSSDTHVATVSGDGTKATVAALAAGEASITVTTDDGGRTDTFRMIVGDGSVPANGVTLDRTAMGLVPGGSALLTATLWPDDATDQAMTWDSSNKSAVTVVGNGPTAMVTAVAAGQSTVTVKTADGGYTADCNVTVAPYTVPVTGITLNNPSLDVLITGTGTLTATLLPSNAAAVVPTWTSSNTGVATVAANATGLTGTITPVAQGFTTITATASGKTASCSVTVSIIPLVSLSLPATMNIAGNRGPVAITATPTPSNATNVGTIAWESNRPSVAAVASTGARTATITPGTDGTATITARSGSITATCVVTVATPPVVITSFPKQTFVTQYAHSLAIRDNGKLYAWGVAGTRGRLGDGSPSADRNVPTPVAVVGTDTWRYVDANEVNSAGIQSDGTLWCWGSNENAQLGNGTTTVGTQANPTPLKVNADTDWVIVACGGNHTMAIKTDGSLWAWGRNNDGQLGLDSSTNRFPTPQPVGTDKDWVSVSCGTSHTVALKNDGSMWTWGYNASYQLGQDNTATLRAPKQVGTLNAWRKATAGPDHCMALQADGTIWGFGSGNYGRLGTGATSSVRIPTKPQNVGLGTYRDVSAGWWNSIAIQTDGTIWGCGDNDFGLLGTGTTGDKTSFTKATTPAGVTDFVRVSVGRGIGMALRSNGELFTWSDKYNENGHGLSSANPILTPARMGDWTWMVP